MPFAETIRQTRLRRGKSLRAVAAAAGVGASNLSAIENGRREPTTATVERLAKALDVRFVAVPAGRSTVAETADFICRAEADGRPDEAYRAFIQLADDLAASSPFDRVKLVADDPAPGRSRWLDALAGLVELRLKEVNLPAPDWACEYRGDPSKPWEPQRSRRPLPVHADLGLSPEPLRRRGVAIEAGELESV